jgi:hypothetical protein
LSTATREEADGATKQNKKPRVIKYELVEGKRRGEERKVGGKKKNGNDAMLICACCWFLSVKQKRIR